MYKEEEEESKCHASKDKFHIPAGNASRMEMNTKNKEFLFSFSFVWIRENKKKL